MSVLLPTQHSTLPSAFFCGKAWWSKTRQTPSWRRSRQSQRNADASASAWSHAAPSRARSSGWATPVQSLLTIRLSAGMPV